MNPVDCFVSIHFSPLSQDRSVKRDLKNPNRTTAALGSPSAAFYTGFDPYLDPTGVTIVS